MKQLIKKIIRKIYYWAELQNLSKQEEPKDNDYHQLVTYIDAKFHSTAIVHNGQNNKEKIVVGNGTHVSGTLLIFPYGGEIVIGNNCYVGDLSRIWSAESVRIGNDVLISHNVNIVDTNSHEVDAIERAINTKKTLAFGLPTEKGSVLSAPIVIEDKAWISFNVIILKGVTIGQGAIVAAGSVVTKNVEPFTMVAGNPAVFIKKLEGNS